jgi:hypothetical protein
VPILSAFTLDAALRVGSQGAVGGCTLNLPRQEREANGLRLVKLEVGALEIAQDLN